MPQSSFMPGSGLPSCTRPTRSRRSIVPPVRFAEDQYPPAALWIIADGGPLVVAFVIATLAGWLLRTGKNSEIRTAG